ncbi:MAG TPA: pyridoxamine 5'-phosphate oxidase family protein [Anaerolineales bacterium]|nr:pyridoxamine 5'-phosphate oxidase family protein [Anaerolineales bacterium]
MSAKQVSKKNQANPIPDRPQIPAEYGIPKNNKGLLTWDHVTERMTRAMHYWICTVGPDNHPHVTPVDGLWLDDKLYFGGSSQTRRSRNLAANSAVSVHLDSSDDVVILYGQAQLEIPNHALAVQLAKVSAEKYGYGPRPEDYEKTSVHVFRTHTVIAWTQFPKDATRWQFSNRE